MSILKRSSTGDHLHREHWVAENDLFVFGSRLVGDRLEKVAGSNSWHTLHANVPRDVRYMGKLDIRLERSWKARNEPESIEGT